MDKGLWGNLGKHLNGEQKSGIDQRTLSMHMRDALKKSICEVYYQKRVKDEERLPMQGDGSESGGFENIGPEGF